MKTKIYITVVLAAAILSAATAQQSSKFTTTDSLQHFDKAYWFDYSAKLNLNDAEQAELITAHQKAYLKDTYYPTPKQSASSSQVQAACTNIDFENGNMNGWTLSTGWHPLFNSLGCCPNPGGAQVIVGGTGTDPCGGFPIVCPGGNFSLLLGDAQVGGIADRIEQTFMVNQSNAFFTYKYAVVFQDPGHTVAQQPSFKIEMIDSNNVAVPCTFYNVSAGQGITGFVNSQNCPGVQYKPWTTAVVDLTNYIGQNVTIRFSTYDCALGGHYGYAYLDGSCMQFPLASNDSICPGGSKQICAPAGFGSYLWNGPGMTNVVGQCVTANSNGTYTVTTTMNTGCTGPVFTYNIYNYAVPNVAITSVNTSCFKNVNYLNASSISSGSISSYYWNFGNGSFSTSTNASNTYANAGTYGVTLTAVSNHGCSSSAQKTITIYDTPVVNLSAPTVCQGAGLTFTNNSSIPTGSISSWAWNFGDSNTSNTQSPSHLYTGFGSFVVTLNATSNFGCTASNTILVTVNPKPVLSFNTAFVCEGITNYFTNTSSIPSGTIANWFWDYNGDTFVDGTAQNPGWMYPGAGNYTVILTAVSNANCSSSISQVVTVHPKPLVNFVAADVCIGGTTSFTNLSTVGNGNFIAFYNWNFGNNTTSAAQNPQVVYGNPGSYNVILTVTSNNNCSNSNTISTTVNPKPVPNFSTTTTCLNQATQFSNSSTIQSGTITKYKWDFDSNGIYDDSTASPTYIYPNYGNYNGKLLTISNNNCASQKVNIVIVHANPTADFGTKSTCLGDNTNYKNYSSSPDGIIVSNMWDFNGDNYMDNMFKDPTTTYTANGVYMTRLEVQTEYGCVNVKTKSVYVNARPIAKFNAPNPKGCNGVCIKFNNQSSIPSGTIVTNQWMFGDNTLPDYSKNPSHCYTNGSYNVSLTVVSDSGCLGSYIVPDYVTVYPSPKAGFAVTPDEIDEDQPVITVTNESHDATSIKYFLNDGHYYSKENFQHVVNTTKLTKKLLIYQLVKNTYGCSDSTYKVLEIKPSYALYIPNTFTPNEDGLNDGFQAKGVGIETFKMQIFDRWGHLVFETDDINKPWNGNDKKGDNLIKEDTYVWKAQVMDVFHKNHDLVGHVLVLK